MTIPRWLFAGFILITLFTYSEKLWIFAQGEKEESIKDEATIEGWLSYEVLPDGNVRLNNDGQTIEVAKPISPGVYVGHENGGEEVPISNRPITEPERELLRTPSVQRRSSLPPQEYVPIPQQQESVRPCDGRATPCGDSDWSRGYKPVPIHDD